MDTTIDQQVAMDEALVPHAKRLRIERSNFRLLSDIKSKESTLQLVYDVMRLTLFFKAFLVTADVSKIYMQEFWATATVHHHSILFKMDNKKHIVNLESFREILHIFPRLPHQPFVEPPFVEPPFDEEILAFLCFLGHSAVKHKDTKKSNEMYYPRFTKVIIHHFMSKDPSILRRNKVNWHYVRNDHMFSTIKLPKASVWKTRSSFDTTITPPTAALAKASKAKSLSALSKVAMTEAQQVKLATKRSRQQKHISQASGSGADEETGDNDEGKDGDDDDGDDGEAGDGDDGDEDDDGEEGNDDDDQEDEGDDYEDDKEKGNDDEQASDEEEFIHPSLSTHAEEEPRDEESFDHIPKTPEDTDDEGNGEENLGLNVGREEGHNKEEEEEELYRDVNINQGREPRDEESFDHIPKTPEDTDDEGNGEENLGLNVGREEGHNKEEEEEELYRDVNINQGRGIQTTQEVEDSHVTLTPVNPDDYDENMQKIIKEQVKDQVKVQVFKILPKIEQTVNEQLEAEVLTQSSNSSKTSYTVVADLSEMELKKILIENIEGNKSIHRSNEQRNLYKALVEAYESDKIILDTYGETVTLKRRRDDDADKDEESSARPNRGSKRRREGKEPESASALQKTATRSTGRSTQGSKSRQTLASESAAAEEPMQTTFEMEEPSHPEYEIGVDDQPIVE
nr:hypothetical protein [Tanacetum cinerariifolium]